MVELSSRQFFYVFAEIGTEVGMVFCVTQRGQSQSAGDRRPVNMRGGRLLRIDCQNRLESPVGEQVFALSNKAQSFVVAVELPVGNARVIGGDALQVAVWQAANDVTGARIQPPAGVPVARRYIRKHQ